MKDLITRGQRLIDPALKNKVKIESNALLDTRKLRHKKQNAELFIDGNVSLGLNGKENVQNLLLVLNVIQILI